MKKIFAILSLVLFCGLVNGQTKEELDKMNPTRKIMYGDALMSAGSYYNAQDVYKMAYDQEASQESAYKLARAYYLARNYKDAEKWYKTAMDAGKSKDEFPDAGFYYAMSLKYNGKYAEAKEAFKAVQKNSKLKGASATALKRQAKNEDKGCDLAIELAKKPAIVNVEHLGNNVNNNYTDFSPRLNPDNNLTYASLVSEDVIDMGSQKKTELKARIFVSPAGDDDTWGKAKEMTAPFNKGDAHTGNGAYSPDGKRFYYTECKPNDSLQMICKIYVSEYESGNWGNSKEVSQVNHPDANTTHPAVATYKGKEYLYFSSNRPGGRGGMDIWYSEIQNKGKNYTTPMNAGTKVNTSGDEITPYYDDETTTMYFSSNGQINIGGFDIYKTKGGQKTFEAPQNLGLPFNSSVDDFGYSQDKTGKKGFFVSNRKGGFSVKSETCCDDIYAFKYPPEFVIMARAVDETTNEPIYGASIDLMQSGSKKDSSVSKTSTQYEDFFVGTAQDKFELVAHKEKYENGQATTSTVGIKKSDTLFIDIPMKPIIELKPIEVKNIYYTLGTWDLRPESFRALDSIYNILALSPQLKVEVASHTDSRDTEEKNMILSGHRADTVVSYLVSKGISKDRLVAKGYGESTPKTLSEDVKLPSSGKTVPKGTVLTEAFINIFKGDDYEYLHQLNRRTEFTIIGIIPNAIIKYDEATIEANEARQREEDEKRNKKLQDLQQVDESDVIDNSTPDTNTKTSTTTTNKGKTTTTPTTATLDATLTKKGNMYEGTAAVNGKEQTKYILNLSPSIVVAMVGKDYFMKLWDSGAITEADIKNDKPTDLGNGTIVKGDIFTIKSLQLGDITLTNVDCKINLTSTQNLVVGVKVAEKGGCEFDQTKAKFKCK